MEPKFNAPQGGYGAELLCPKCKGNLLRHERIEIFERTEDAEKGLHVSVVDGAIAVDTNLAGNPSMRRHGLVIHFHCEGCSAASVLKVHQHKGNTFVDFSAD